MGLDYLIICEGGVGFFSSKTNTNLLIISKFQLTHSPKAPNQVTSLPTPLARAASKKRRDPFRVFSPRGEAGGYDVAV